MNDGRRETRQPPRRGVCYFLFSSTVSKTSKKRGATTCVQLRAWESCVLIDVTALAGRVGALDDGRVVRDTRSAGSQQQMFYSVLSFSGFSSFFFEIKRPNRLRIDRHVTLLCFFFIQANLTHLGRNEYVPGVGMGIAKCPFDPSDNSTAVWVERGNPGDLPALYSGTNAEFTKADAVIFRTDLYNYTTGRREYTFKRTLKYDSKWLDSKFRPASSHWRRSLNSVDNSQSPISSDRTISETTSTSSFAKRPSSTSTAARTSTRASPASARRTTAERTFCRKTGQLSSKPVSTAPSRENSLSTSTKSVRVSSSILYLFCFCFFSIALSPASIGSSTCARPILLLLACFHGNEAIDCGHASSLSRVGKRRARV